jgi:hypothetical protein
MCAAAPRTVTNFESGQHYADGNGELLYIRREVLRLLSP